MKNFLLGFCVLLTFTVSHAQFMWTPVTYGTTTGLHGFDLNNQYYKASPKGLLKFIEDTNLEPTLEGELRKQQKRIKSKSIASNVIFYGGFLASGTILLSQAETSTEYGDETPDNAGPIIAGLGLFVASTVTYLIMRPKEQDYLDFINTYNKSQPDEKDVEVGFLLQHHSNQLNYGVAITF